MVFKAMQLDEFSKGVSIDRKEKSPKIRVRMMRIKPQKKQRKSIRRGKRKTRRVWQSHVEKVLHSGVICAVDRESPECWPLG